MRKPHRRRATLIAGAVALAVAVTVAVTVAVAVAVVGAEATGSRVRDIPFWQFPSALALSPDGHTVYVAAPDSADGHGVVEALDPATGRAGRQVRVSGNPLLLAITPDGSTMFATDCDTLMPMDVAAGAARPPIRTGIDPYGDCELLMSRDGRTLYISGKTRIRRYDIASARFGSDVPADDPAGMLLSHDGKTLWYASGDGQVVAVDLATGAVRKRITMGGATQSLALTPDGRILYVGLLRGTDNGDVVPLNPATGAVGPPIHVTASPDAMVMSPDGRTLYVLVTTPVFDSGGYAESDSGVVTPITIATGSAGPSVTVGTGPAAMAITPDGSKLYVANEDSDTISAISLIP